MERREFIKLSSLAVAWLATNSAVTRALAGSPIIEGESILIYRMVHYKKGIQVKATMYGNWIGNKRKTSGGWMRQVVDPQKYDVSTFEIVTEVSSAEANEVKWKHWQELGCKGQYVPYDKSHFIRTGKMCRNSPGYQAYLQSDKRKEDMTRMGQSGATAAQKVIEEKWGSSAEHMKYVTSKITPEQRAIAIAKTIHNNKTLPKTQKQIEASRYTGKKWGKINGDTHGKAKLASFTPEQKLLYCSMGGKGGGPAKQVDQGNHNFLPHLSPNNNYMLCPDGHITTRPSAIIYCRNRGLNVDQCQHLTKEQVKMMQDIKPKRTYTHSNGISHKAKLTSDDVLRIRGELRSMKSEEVAKMFGISNTACKKVRSGETYSHIKQ
jgi:hypothetical protein